MGTSVPASQASPLSAIPVGGEVDREVIFAADSPRDLTPIEVLAIAVLEGWADEGLRNFTGREVLGDVADVVYDEMMPLVSKALEHVYRSGQLALDMGIRAKRLEAAQCIREGSVRGAS